MVQKIVVTMDAILIFKMAALKKTYLQVYFNYTSTFCW